MSKRFTRRRNGLGQNEQPKKRSTEIPKNITRILLKKSATIGAEISWERYSTYALGVTAAPANHQAPDHKTCCSSLSLPLRRKSGFMGMGVKNEGRGEMKSGVMARGWFSDGGKKWGCVKVRERVFFSLKKLIEKLRAT
jgi:hypothetical protein